jgi:hypothetical protein
MDAPVIEYDHATAVISVNGVRMSWEFFCALSELKPGTWLRIEPSHVPGGKLVCRTVSDEVAKTFNAILGSG